MRTSIPGRSASKKPNKLLSSSGLTLIELLVAMAIVGIIVALSATGLRSAFDANMKGSSGKLASMLRYLSNKAVVNHLYIRVIYDLDGNSYSVEECQEPILVSIEEEEGASAAKDEELKIEDEEEGEEGEKKTADSSCVPSESSLLKPVKLPSDVLFKDVTVSYLKGPREQGKAVTYFFPDGYATPTLINFKDEEDETHYSVELEALSGRARVTAGYKDSFTGWGKEDGS